MFNLLIIASVFVCVTALVGSVAMILRGDKGDDLASRLSNLTQNGGRGRSANDEQASVLHTPLDDLPSQAEVFVSKFLNLRLYLEQSGLTIEPSKFLLIAGGFGTAGAAVYFFLSPIKILTPLFFLMFATLPFLYLLFVRKRRLKRFGGQLPEALELMSRALRAGHSLPAGIQLVGQQMSEPIGPEFNRCYEEQNLGVPLEEAIRVMTERVPNVDLRFFATAVILQRQTGGDLAEILDKIGKLIRERFQIWGQIQALTGEGRLSGIVLLALPPVLFLVMLRLNYDYVMMLFTDPLGQKMLIAGIISQAIGAAVIKKIITIKV